MGRYLLLGSIVMVLLSCQTAELDRLRSENESLHRELSVCKNEETQLRQREKELLAQMRSLEGELKELQQTRDRLTGDNEALKTRIDQLQRELVVLKEDHQYLRRVLEELRFTTQSNLGEYNSPDSGQKGLEVRSGLVRITQSDGRVEYFDTSTTSLEGPSLYLSIEEKREGTLSLYLNIQHGYWVVRQDYSVVGIALSKGGRTFSIPYTSSDVQRVEQGGFRKEIVRLPVKGKILEILKEIAKGEGEIHLIIAFPDFSMDRVLSRLEVQALGNVYYAFREMGGTL